VVVVVGRVGDVEREVINDELVTVVATVVCAILEAVRLEVANVGLATAEVADSGLVNILVVTDAVVVSGTRDDSVAVLMKVDVPVVGI
jgi:hypothetical protein